MEMPELNEDILEGETNPEVTNQAEDSGSLDESALQPDGQTPMEVDTSQTKLPEEVDSENKIKEQSEGNEAALDDSDLQKQNEEPKEEAEPQGEILSESLEQEKQEDEDEGVPAAKKIKLDEGEKELPTEPELDEQDQLKQEPELEGGGEPQVEPKPEPEPEPEIPAQPPQEEPEAQPEGGETQEMMDVKKEDEEEKPEVPKEGEKPGAGTDMLATLASAALDQDPKDKTTAAAAPKSPVPKAEPETPKKKPEQWCNVGVFDTNTTIVSDYLATPEPNEHVDLVTATLEGRRIQLEPGTAYKFRVCAVNGCGTGPWSDVAAFKTTLPGFPGAPSAIKISKSPEGAHLTWEPPGGNSSEILEYAVYLAVRSASQGCQPVTTNQAQLAFVRVFCGPTNKCMVGTNSLQAAHIDTTTKPAIIFRIAARNSKGYGPATQVRWLQESVNGTTQGVKRTVKS